MKKGVHYVQLILINAEICKVQTIPSAWSRLPLLGTLLSLDVCKLFPQLEYDITSNAAHRFSSLFSSSRSCLNLELNKFKNNKSVINKIEEILMKHSRLHCVWLSLSRRPFKQCNWGKPLHSLVTMNVFVIELSLNCKIAFNSWNDLQRRTLPVIDTTIKLKLFSGLHLRSTFSCSN